MSIKIYDNIEQGSQEWLDIRRGVLTASKFNKVITSKGDVSATMASHLYQLVGEELSSSLEESYKSAAMARGNELEEEARERYQDETLNFVSQTGFMLLNDCGYSPDGLIGEDGIIEIKCPLQATHAKYLYHNKLPSEYKAQVQGGLYVTGRKWCDFVSYNPHFVPDKQILIVRVYRDEDFITKLEEIVNKISVKKQNIINKIKNDNE